MGVRGEVEKTAKIAGERFGEAAKFFRSFTEKPLQLGSVTPSSRYLSRAVAGYVDPRDSGPVIEIGAGTGPVTEALIRRGIPESRLVLLEYSSDFCDILRRRFPAATVVQGDAFALARTLDGVLGEKASAVICGMPIIMHPEAVRLDLLRQAFSLLKPGAPFIQFTYSVVSPIPLKDAFFTAKASPRIWRNVPPARVWVYRQPLKN
jgi:phosphatidylethanolamine/phosphatidyl-N-methylethanolamine N-methyltransferase